MGWQYVTDDVLKTICKDDIQVEIRNRIVDIDNNKVSLTPYNEGINEMMERIKAKFYKAEVE